ncbi:MAG: hypothetical protein U0Q20_12560 [Mycobacterium sp.]|nr:hypothetical protein [Mycobacterium sp.]
MATKAAARTDRALAVRLAALASLGAAVIHCAVAPAHWQEWLPAGLFFVSIAVFQLLWARVVLSRSTPPVLAAAIVINSAALALWVMSRTAGAPFGPQAGVPELVQAADLCALLLQVYVVMGAGWAWYRGRHGEPIPAFANAAVLLGAMTVVALASTVGVASGLRHGHHGPAGDHHGPSIEHAEGRHGHHPEPVLAPPVFESAATPAAPAPTDTPRPRTEPLSDAHGAHEHAE